MVFHCRVWEGVKWKEGEEEEKTIRGNEEGEGNRRHRRDRRQRNNQGKQKILFCSVLMDVQDGW